MKTIRSSHTRMNRLQVKNSLHVMETRGKSKVRERVKEAYLLKSGKLSFYLHSAVSYLHSCFSPQKLVCFYVCLCWFHTSVAVRLKSHSFTFRCTCGNCSCGLLAAKS